MKPLAGLRVIECGTLIAGPFAGRLLADLGAEVIKIETPGKGDPMREWGHHRYKGRTLWWPSMARNKKSITLDLHHPRGQAIARELFKRADITVENFRPGTMERWNLGDEQIKVLNPKLIMVRVSGFGQTGPYREKAGFGSIGEAIGGVRHITGYPDRPPPRIGISLGDSLAAMFGVIGALAAVYHREVNKAGTGQVVDVGIYEAVYALMESALSEYDKLKVVRERSGPVLPNVAPSNLYQTKDHKYALIAANADNVFRRLMKAIGKEELTEDPRFATHHARGENMKDLDAIIEAWTCQRNCCDVLALMDEVGVPASSIYTIADIANDPHYRARDMLLTINDPELGDIKMQGIVPKLSATPGSVDWTGPRLGEHNDEIYKGLLGLSDQEIQELLKEKII